MTLDEAAEKRIDEYFGKNRGPRDDHDEVSCVLTSASALELRDALRAAVIRQKSSGNWFTSNKEEKQP